MLRDYIDSMPKAGDSDRAQGTRQASFFEHDKYQIEQIIETIETYLNYPINPDFKIERVDTGGETDGESEESDSDRAQGTSRGH